MFPAQILQYSFVVFNYQFLQRAVTFFWDKVFMFSYKIWLLQSTMEEESSKSHPPHKHNHFLKSHVTHAKLQFSVSRTDWSIQQKRRARVDQKFAYKTHELKTVFFESNCLLLSTSNPLIFLSFLMSSHLVIQLPLGFFFQQCVEFFHQFRI